MKDLQFSLYEVFGYLMPGLLAVTASVMIHWTAFLKGQFVIKEIGGPLIFGSLFFAYIGGHILQGLANLITSKSSSAKRMLGPGGLPLKVREEASSFVEVSLRASGGAHIDEKTVFEYCDWYVHQKGKSDGREIFIYREGFYRGMFAASLLLALAFFVRFWCERSSITIGKFVHHFGKWEMLSFSILALLASFFFFQRYKRFGDYLVRHAIISALVIKTDIAQSQKAAGATP